MKKVQIALALIVLAMIQASAQAMNDGVAELVQGNKLALQGNYKEAITAFDQAIKTNPRLAQAYSHRAAALVKLGEYDSALADCTKAIRLDRKNVRALVLRGLIYKQLGKRKKELKDMRAAKKLLDSSTGH